MYPDGWPKWMAEFERIYHKAVPPVEEEIFSGAYKLIRTHRKWYVGDEAYYEALTNRFHEDCVLVDRVATNPICATMIRQNPVKHWDKISAPFKRVYSHNILICGTASEGKTTLTEDVGKYFNAPYSSEYARQYMKESSVSDPELGGDDFMSFILGQHELNKSLINSSGNNGIFFSDTDAMVTRMYAEYYAKDGSCELTQDDFEVVAAMADYYTRKCKWDKIFLVAPHGKFVDDHTRFMNHSGMDERHELYEILCNNIKRMGLWDKVTVLKGNYYENFMAVVNYTNEVIEHGKLV